MKTIFNFHFIRRYFFRGFFFRPLSFFLMVEWNAWSGVFAWWWYLINRNVFYQRFVKMKTNNRKKLVNFMSLIARFRLFSERHISRWKSNSSWSKICNKKFTDIEQEQQQRREKTKLCDTHPPLIHIRIHI